MTIKIGIISDTHGLLRPEVLQELQSCDQIIHAGDFDNESVLEELESIAPVYAVRGNNDWGWASRLKRKLSFDIAGIHFVMAHSRSDIPWKLQGVDVVIFGHTHQYYEDYIDGRLWLNPGSCGWPRFRRELSMALLTVEADRQFTVKLIDIQP